MVQLTRLSTKAAGSAAFGEPRGRGRRAIIAVVAAAVAAGLPSVRGTFLQGDDQQLIRDFAPVRYASPANALRLLDPAVHRDLYQPVPLLMASAELALARLLRLGPAGEAGLLHLTNVLIHAVNAWLVWALLADIQRDRRLAFGAALLFAIHPLAAEPVAWISGRMTLLSATFSLMAVRIAAAPSDHRGGWRVALIPLFSVLAMCSKLQVGLPVLLVLVLAVRRKRPSVPMVLAVLAATLVTAGSAVLNLRLSAGDEVLAAGGQALGGSRLARTVFALGWYLRKVLLPVGLSHTHPADPALAWADRGVLLGGIVVVLWATIVVLSLRRIPAVAVGSAWFLACAAGSLPLVAVRNVAVAERYVYLASLGLFWALSAGLWLVYERLRGTARIAVAGGVAAAGGVLLGLHWYAAAFYRDDVRVTRRAASLYPHAPGVWEHLARACYRSGHFAEALTAARRELANGGPFAARAYQVAGLAQLELGQVDEALQSLEASVRTEPRDPRAWLRLGEVLERLGRNDQALAAYRRAARSEPSYAPAALALAAILRATNQSEEARRAYEQALQANPYEWRAAIGLAEMDLAAGHVEAAVNRLTDLLDWMPDNVSAWTLLGLTHMRTQQADRAEEAFRRALERDPTHLPAALNLALLLETAGRTSQAVAILARAAPSTADRELLWAAHEFWIRQGRPAEAVRLWSHALAIEPRAADLRAAYAWAAVLAGQTATAREHALAAQGTDASAGGLTARMALAVEALVRGDPAPAVSLVRTLVAENSPAEAATRRRFLQGLSLLGDSRPTDPWPYYLAGELLESLGQHDAAELGRRRFRELCSGACIEQARQLGIMP